MKSEKVPHHEPRIANHEPRVDYWPPCRVACPVHADVQKYVSLVAQGNTGEALDVIRQTILFAAVCGRICPHPCEEACRRNQVDEPVAICSLKRFAADVSYSQLKPTKPSKKINKKIAIIGAGPSGLACSHDLARLGYQVTVFEKAPEPGGMLRYGVPRYRLPTRALMQDIKPILAAGVKLKTGVEIGKDTDFSSLKRQGFKAILISVGLSVSRGLNIVGAELDGIILAIPFLQAANSGKKVKIGKKVIVVGGGDVAMDVARTCLRLGAKEVNIACLECGDEIPAHSWELEETQEEGAKLHPAKGPKRFLGKDGKVTGIELMGVKSVFDKNGRFCPTFYQSRTSTIKGDMVILAIGQASDFSFLEGTDVAFDARKRLVWDASTLSTTEAGVFACGEVATGPGSAIEAIASGHKAARTIDSYLSNKPIEPQEEKAKVGELNDKNVERSANLKRQLMPTVKAAQRLRNFDQFELGFGQEAGLREAVRCLNCAVGAEVIEEKCTTCLTCVRVCPYEAPYIEDGEFKGIDIFQCQACGMCPSYCPAKAIEIDFSPEEAILPAVEEHLVKRSSDKLAVGLYCRYHLLGNGRPNNSERIPQPKNTLLYEVFCPARLKPNLFLKLFEAGVGKVLVARCPDEECRFLRGNVQIAKRLDYLRDILEEIGLDKNRLKLFDLGNDKRTFNQNLKVVLAQKLQ